VATERENEMTTREVAELTRRAENASQPLVAATRAFLAASSTDTEHELLAARVLYWLCHGVGSLNRQEIRDALSDPDASEALTRMIEHLRIEGSEQSAVARASVRGARRRRELLEAEGGWLTAEEAAERLPSRAALDKRRARGTILALPLAGEYVYPVWQFDESTLDGLLPRLREVLESFGVESPWMRLEFLLAHHEQLGGRRAVDALAEGDAADREAVRRLAGTYGEQGAR
jgi:hypothetical protein